MLACNAVKMTCNVSSAENCAYKATRSFQCRLSEWFGAASWKGGGADRPAVGMLGRARLGEALRRSGSDLANVRSKDGPHGGVNVMNMTMRIFHKVREQRLV